MTEEEKTLFDIYEVPIKKRPKAQISETETTPTEVGSVGGASKVDKNVLNGRILSERYFELLEKRQKLPCFEARDALVKLVMEN